MVSFSYSKVHPGKRFVSIVGPEFYRLGMVANGPFLHPFNKY